MKIEDGAAQTLTEYAHLHAGDGPGGICGWYGRRCAGMKVRVKFAKYDNMRFIGHLDVMRFFQKALRRAGIDVAYSTGFSPHQIMSLHRRSGWGCAAMGEYMDIELRSAEG